MKFKNILTAVVFTSCGGGSSEAVSKTDSATTAIVDSASKVIDSTAAKVDSTIKAAADTAKAALNTVTDSTKKGAKK